MKNEIEPFISITDWVKSDASLTIAENEVPAYIAGLNAKSIVFGFPSGSLNEYFQKTVAFDLTQYTELTVHIWSRNKKGAGQRAELSSEYAYKLDIGTGVEYYIPTFLSFYSFTIDISDVTTIDKIKITALHDDADYVILSHMVAVMDEIPRDIFADTKEWLESVRDSLYPLISGGVVDKGVLLGTVTATAGDASIGFSNHLQFLDKYAVITIEGGGNSETHQIDHNDERMFYFNSLYDSETLQNSYTTANVYLTIPVEFGVQEKEVILPGVAIWGMEPEEIIRSNKEDEIRDTFKTNETVRTRLERGTFLYRILIDCDARQNELIAFMSQFVRVLIAREFIFVNGKRFDVGFEGVPTYLEPNEPIRAIPKIQYIMRIEVKEEIWPRETQVKTVKNTRTYDIQTV